jgi:hypothetical protein
MDRTAHAVVLAVPELDQAVVGDGVIAAAGGGVEPDALDGQGRDVAMGAPEVGLEGLPGRRVGEPLEDQGQAVVGELDGPDRLADEGFEGVRESVGPGLDVGLAVVGPGEDVSDPGGDDPSVGEPLVERVWGEMPVEDVGGLELGEEAEEQGDIIDPFVGQFEGGFHGGSPTRVSGDPSLYRAGTAGEKIQAERREHGNYR